MSDIIDVRFQRRADRRKRTPPPPDGRGRRTAAAVRRFIIALLLSFGTLVTQVSAGQGGATSAAVKPPLAPPTLTPAPTPVPLVQPAAPIQLLPKADRARQREFARLERAVRAIAREAGGVIGVYYQEVGRPERLAIEADREFYAASLRKLPVVLYLYHLAANGRVSLDETVAYQDEDYEEGTGVLQGIKPGAQLTLRRLAELAITESDNIASNMLIRRLGNERIVAYMRALGAEAAYADDNVTTPRDMARYLSATWEFRAQHPQLGDELFGYLTHTAFNDRIPALLPETATVAHKIGTFENAVNDAGIVVEGRRAYLLAVLTEGAEEEVAAPAIARIAKAVDEFGRQGR